MRATTGVIAGVLLICGSAAQANRLPEPARSANSDVVVDMPAEVWTRQENRPLTSCLQCCIYENRSYSEGAVVKAEGVLLQCTRDEKALGTNPLLWKIIR